MLTLEIVFWHTNLWLPYFVGGKRVPRYDYRCQTCDHEFELRQSFSSEPVADCPECGGNSRRLIRAVPVVFKGSGFYVNDYGKGSNGTTKSDSDKTSDNKKTTVDPKNESGAKKETESKSKPKAKSDSGSKSDSKSKKEKVS